MTPKKLRRKRKSPDRFATPAPDSTVPPDSDQSASGDDDCEPDRRSKTGRIGARTRGKGKDWASLKHIALSHFQMGQLIEALKNLDLGERSLYSIVEETLLTVDARRVADPEFEKEVLKICALIASRRYAEGAVSQENRLTSAVVKTHCAELGLDLENVLPTYLDEDSWSNQPTGNSGRHPGRSTAKKTMTIGVIGRTVLSHMMRNQIFPEGSLSYYISQCDYGVRVLLQGILGRWPTNIRERSRNSQFPRAPTMQLYCS